MIFAKSFWIFIFIRTYAFILSECINSYVIYKKKHKKQLWNVVLAKDSLWYWYRNIHANNYILCVASYFIQALIYHILIFQKSGIVKHWTPINPCSMNIRLIFLRLLMTCHWIVLEEIIVSDMLCIWFLYKINL